MVGFESVVGVLFVFVLLLFCGIFLFLFLQLCRIFFFKGKKARGKSISEKLSSLATYGILVVVRLFQGKAGVKGWGDLKVKLLDLNCDR